MIEAGACLPNIKQSSLPVVEPKNKRAEIFPGALGIGVASDDALLALRDFNFEPIARTLFFVTTIAFLRDDAFEATLLRRFKEIETLFGKVIGKMDEFAGFDSFLQELLALFERDATQVEAIQVEQVERVIDDWNA